MPDKISEVGRPESENRRSGGRRQQSREVRNLGVSALENAIGVSAFTATDR